MKRSTDDIHADEQASAFLTLVRACDIGVIIAAVIAVLWLLIAAGIAICREFGLLYCSVYVAISIVLFAVIYYRLRSHLKVVPVQKQEEE